MIFSMYRALQFAHRIHICLCFFTFSRVRFFMSYSLVMPAVVIRQRKAFRRKNGLFIYFEGKLQTCLIFKNHSSICFSILCCLSRRQGNRQHKQIWRSNFLWLHAIGLTEVWQGVCKMTITETVSLLFFIKHHVSLETPLLTVVLLTLTSMVFRDHRKQTFYNLHCSFCSPSGVGEKREHWVKCLMYYLFYVICFTCGCLGSLKK